MARSLSSKRGRRTARRPGVYCLYRAELRLAATLLCNIAFFIGALCSSATAQGIIQGKVLDPAGMPVAGASITARNILNGAARQQETSVTGEFRLEGLSAGSYSLIVAVKDFAGEEHRVEVQRDETVQASDFRLSLARVSAETTVVSGSRIAELEEESPMPMAAVTKEEIRDTGYEQVADVLSEVPGIVTRGTSYGVGLVGAEQINGISSNETLVLQDGLPVPGGRGIQGGYIDISQQDVGKVDRVEVVEGAASSLYGTDAIGGVINLITREPAHPFDLDADLSGGSLGAVDGRLALGSKCKNLTAFTDLESHHVDSYSLLPDDPTTAGANENRQDILVKLRYQFNPRIALGFTSSVYQDQQSGEIADAGPPTALRSNESTQTYALTGDFLLTDTTSLQERLYASRYSQNSHSNLLDDGAQGTAFDQGNLNENYHRADATLGQSWGSRQYLQGGMEWAQDFYRGDNRLVGGNAGQQVTTDDLWMQDRIQPSRNLTVTLGGRYQHNSSYGGHVVPKAGLVYRLNDHVLLRASVGEGFRAPNLGELYYHLLHLEYGYQVIGNPNLRPEMSQSYSTGATFSASRYRLTVNLFRNSLRDLINTTLVCDATSGQNCSGAALEQLLTQYGVPSSFEYDTTGAALFTFINQNVDRAYTQGFNVSSEVALNRSLKFTGAYTYLEGVDSLNHIWLTGDSRHQGQIKLQYERPRWGFRTNIRATFLSRWPTAAPGDYAFGYQIWKIYASKNLTKGLEAYGSIENLFNSRDPKLNDPQPSYDRPDYGRLFRIGLRYTLPHGG